MAGKAKIQERQHPLYSDNIDDWEFFEISTKGGREYLESGNLFSHRLESEDDDFDERLSRSYYLNFCDSVIQTYTNYIMKEKIERPEDVDLKLLRKDTTGRGDSIDSFMGKVAYQSAMYGMVHVLVDMPEEPINAYAKTKAGERESEPHPYCTIIPPTKLRDWSLDSDGNLNWIIIEDLEYEDSDPTEERSEIITYKLITRDRWEVFDDNGESIRSGDNELGEVPLVTCYHKDIDIDLIGESLIKDIAYVNRIIYNWCSCIDEMIERQTFSQLIIPDDGTLADQEEESDPLKKIGTSSAWTFNADASQPPQFISPDTSNLQVIWEMIIAHIREIHRLAGLTGVSEDLYTAQRSGRSQQYGFINISSSLAAKSKNLERTENRINELAYKWLGKDPSSLEDVVYPTQFDIEVLETSMRTTFEIVEREISETLNKELLKKLSRRALPLANDETKETITKEIDAGDGTIKPATTITYDNRTSDGGRPAGDAGPDGTGTKSSSEVRRSLSASTKSSGGTTGGIPR